MLISVLQHSQSTPNPVTACLSKCWLTESQLFERISFFSQCSPNSCLKSRVTHQIHISMPKTLSRFQNSKTSKNSDFRVSDQQILNHPSNYFPFIVSLLSSNLSCSFLWPLSPLLQPWTSVKSLTSTSQPKRCSTCQALGEPHQLCQTRPDTLKHFPFPRYPTELSISQVTLKHRGEQTTSKLSINQQRNPSNLPDNLNLVCLP